MAKNKIIVFDNNFNKIEEYVFSPDTSYYHFAIANDAIVYSAGKGNIGYINITTNEQVAYDLESLSICSNCPSPINFFADDNSVYFILNKLIYQFDVYSKKIELFVQPIKHKGFKICW